MKKKISCDQMDPDILEKYLTAGRIAAQVREESRAWIEPGVKLIELAERIETRIRELGAQPAFPVNLSLNDAAAHYTPTTDDELALKESDLLKIDIGVHIDGWIGDTAYSISFNPEHRQLIAAAETALAAAIQICKPDTLLSELSAAIEDAIRSAGFTPISNLTGHGLGRFDLHAEPQVPNVRFSSEYRLKENQVIAIEPFATTGVGEVKETPQTLIWTLADLKPVRNPAARRILAFAAECELPFTLRWLERAGITSLALRAGLKELLDRELLHPHPVLKEVTAGLVSQAEHTVIVAEKPIVTTK